MKRPITKKYSIYKNNKIIKKYIKLLLSLDKLKKEREKFIAHHFPLLLQADTKEYQDINTRINSLIDKPNIIPSFCLASSLGFNKNTWNKNVENIMNEFGFGRKAKHFTLRNVIAFEKLKILILKLIEKEKKEKKNL